MAAFACYGVDAAPVEHNCTHCTIHVIGLWMARLAREVDGRLPAAMFVGFNQSMGT